MMDMVLKCLYYISAMVCMVSVGEWTYHWTTRNGKKYLLAGGVYAIAFVLGIVLFPDAIIFEGIFFIAEVVVWSLICEGEYGNKIAKIIVQLFLIGLIESVMSIAMAFLTGDVFGEWANKLLSIICVFLFFYLITRQRWYRKAIAYLDSLSKWKCILIMCVVIFGTGIASMGNLLQGMLDNSRVILIFRLIVAIDLVAVIAVIVWLIIESHQKKYYLEQNSIKEELIRVQQDYYKTIYEKDREMRRFRHDVASQIGVLQLLLEKNEVDSAREQLNRICQDFSQATFQKVQVGDEMLDAVLSMMHQRALEKGINFNVVGEVQGQKECDVYELCTIFSNAISNAIEACQKLEGEKVISVKIREHNQTLCCIFENAATEDMYQAVLNGVTTKEDKDNHGYGIHNIRRAVERLNGSMEYRYKDGKLGLEIYI